MSLITTMSYNDNRGKLFPAIDYNGKVILTEDDKQPEVLLADSAECRDFLKNGQCKVSFWLTGTPAKSWEITITDNRIIVYSKYSMNPFGKSKERSGKVSGGHLLFASVSNLSTFFDNEDKNPVLLVCCYRKDGSRTTFTIKSSDLDLMKEMARNMHDRLDKWIVDNGRKFVDNGSLSENKLEALNKWEQFNNKIWTAGGDVEYTVFIPTPNWDKV